MKNLLMLAALSVAMSGAASAQTMGSQAAGSASSNGHAVTGQAVSSPSLGSQADPGQSYNSLMSMFESEMMGAVKAMPEDKFNFAPASALFVPAQKTSFEKVRTFADQARHVAQANYFFYASQSGLKPDADVRAIGNLKSKDEIVAALAASFVFAHKAIATLTAANANKVIKGADGVQTRATLAAFGIAHGFDHYGQMVVYLRMNGIVPPASR